MRRRRGLIRIEREGLDHRCSDAFVDEHVADRSTAPEQREGHERRC
jgi:hypothetical protein